MLTATFLNRAINDRPYGCGAEFNAALLYGGSFPVSSVTSTPGYRNMRIGINVDAPLKKCVSEKMWRLRRGFIYTSSAASGFSVAFLRRYRYIFCVSPTDGFRLNRYTRNRQDCSRQAAVGRSEEVIADS